jgi:hypothetical protein
MASMMACDKAFNSLSLLFPSMTTPPCVGSFMISLSEPSTEIISFLVLHEYASEVPIKAFVVNNAIGLIFNGQSVRQETGMSLLRVVSVLFLVIFCRTQKKNVIF